MPPSRCPVAPAYPADPTPPVPETLAYSFTLPAALSSPALARATARHVLRTHGLTDMLDPALQAVGELTAVACQFTESVNYYLTLRYRFSALRVIAYDSHPRHTSPHLATACDTRRRAALRLLACVCRACDGTWGFGEAREPGGGTRMWATLPRVSAAAYGLDRAG
ncbi:ATP-binding protein [Streptomyces sp. b94]|uniref:ATP-binding protein n=1 Tax=Streptomyces sp. b94 TaxID=1827634 RepID=UPI001B37407F|nr:ATP-binding protein [Streptomyces sp. b94]MBQ1094543.1 ATP-binding protein [Streptomyces sp. b94]